MSAATAVLVATSALTLTLAADVDTAWAHDAGQGLAVRQGELAVTRTGDRADLQLQLPAPCGDVAAVRAVARRAGQTLRGPLTATAQDGSCRLSGSVDGLSQGRWFVYAEMQDGQGRALESWLPVRSAESVQQIRDVYRPPNKDSTTARNTAGAALLALAAALVVSCLRLARRSSAQARE